MKAPLYNKKGNKKSEVVLNPSIYAARVNRRLLDLVHKAFAANLRHGTADTKVRKEVRGGGAKPWKQKGTGRARHGSSRSPLWVGGGTTFGPHPRSYFVSMSKTMRNEALISAFSLRGDQKNVLLLEDVQLETPKTKEWAEILAALPLNGKKSLCVVNEMNENLKRAAQNLSHVVEVKTAKEVNAYHVLQRPVVIIERNAVSVIDERLTGGKEKTEEKEKPAAKPRKTKAAGAKKGESS